jgi:hypothetical protein
LEIHPTQGDYVSVVGADGEELERFVMADSVCNVDAVCNGPVNGECVKESETDLYGECACHDGFLNGDCSITAKRVFPGQASVRVGFYRYVTPSPSRPVPSLTPLLLIYSDGSNPSEMAGFVAEYFGLFDCPLGDDDEACSGRGDCLLGACVCFADLEFSDEVSCAAPLSAEDEGGVSMVVVAVVVAVAFLLVAGVTWYFKQDAAKKDVVHEFKTAQLETQVATLRTELTHLQQYERAQKAETRGCPVLTRSQVLARGEGDD